MEKIRWVFRHLSTAYWFVCASSIGPTLSWII